MSQYLNFKSKSSRTKIIPHKSKGALNVLQERVLEYQSACVRCYRKYDGSIVLLFFLKEASQNVLIGV